MQVSRAAPWIVMLAGCGRIAFEPLDDSGSSGGGSDTGMQPGGAAARLVTAQQDACHLTPEGHRYCWGSCSSGECGFGDTARRLVPSRVGTAAWSRLGMGRHHTCGIQADGSLWCSGSGASGVLGLNDTNDRLSPTQVGAGTDWLEVCAGRHFTCGLARPGTIWCWGENLFGQLGQGDLAMRLVPTQVGVDTDWTSLACATGYLVFARKRDDSWWVWGGNAFGQLGLGDNTDRASPVPFAMPGTWSSISVGREHTCALRLDGSLWCWGLNSDGQLGLGDMVDRPSPQQVGTAVDWVEVRPSAATHTCARTRDGALHCWGSNVGGSLGVGDTNPRPRPAVVAGSMAWTEVSTGSDFTCARDGAQAVWCWGDNTSGELGTGDQSNRVTPVKVFP